MEKKEFYYGSSFLSQSARFINVDSTMASFVITSTNGQSRQVAEKVKNQKWKSAAPLYEILRAALRSLQTS